MKFKKDSGRFKNNNFYFNQKYLMFNKNLLFKILILFSIFSFPIQLTNATYAQKISDVTYANNINNNDDSSDSNDNSVNNNKGAKTTNNINGSPITITDPIFSITHLHKLVASLIKETTPTNEEISIAKKILTLYFSLEKNAIPQDLIIELNTKIGKHKVFAELTKYIHYAYIMVNAKKLNDYINICPQIKIGVSSSDSSEKVFAEHIERICYDRLFKNASISLKKDKFSSPEVTILFQFIQKNFQIISNSNNIPTFISFLDRIPKKSDYYYKFSSFLTDIFIKKNIRPSPELLQNIHINSELTSFIQHFPIDDFSNVLVNEYKEDINQLMDEIRKKRKNNTSDLNQEEIESKIQGIMNYYSKNKNHLPTYKIYPSTLLLGRFFLNQKLFSQSDVVLRFTNSLSTYDKFYESVYYIFWNKIAQEKYKEALEIVDEFKVKDHLDRAGIKFIFWMAYSLSKKGEIEEAKTYYKRIIEQYPLTYHSVMASKLLSLIMNEEEKKDFSASDGPAKKLLSERLNTRNILPNPSFHKIPASIKTRIKRIQIWSKLNNNYFTNMEATSFVSFNEMSFIEYKKERSIEEQHKNQKILHSQTLILISILSELGYYNKSFNILNSAIEKGFVKPDKLSLLVLFPTPYRKEIELLDNTLDPILVLSLIRQESAFNPNAISSAGARGLMQLMPRTARHTIRKNITFKKLGDPVTNIKIGMTLLKKLINRYNGNLIYALSAYNAGEGNTQKWIDQVFTSDSILHTIEMIPFTETQNYVQSIFRNIYFYKLIHEDQLSDTQSTSKFFDIVLKP
ncbi:MAG: transglycosylase SLT domain-containing protein [Oligoflexia bacterium]|nr:transglycosylase SLT domain-containing protein [Oligoflexia bacterium]